MKKFVFQSVVDAVCTAILSVAVWHYAHWSVALVLTISLVRFSIEDAIERLKKMVGAK